MTELLAIIGMRWTGHLVRTGAAKLALRAEAAKYQGHREGEDYS